MNKKALAGLCPELKALLDHELAAGNRVMATETGWSAVKLAVRLEKPLDRQFIQAAAQNNPDLRTWESRDVKNPREFGVLCQSQKQSLAGPLEKGGRD
jgi:hypothetical protein